MIVQTGLLTMDGPPLLRPAACTAAGSNASSGSAPKNTPRFTSRLCAWGAALLTPMCLALFAVWPVLMRHACCQVYLLSSTHGGQFGCGCEKHAT
jgi:hypothetical protein